MENLLKHLKKEGGATIKLKKEGYKITNYDAGYFVSLKGHETILKNYTVESLKIAIAEKKEVINNLNSYFVGLWIDNDNLYVDISILIEDENDALKIAKEQKQLAIFDNANQKSIYL